MAGLFQKLISWVTHTAIPWYTSLGLTRSTVTLEVQGRRSGKPMRVSVTTVRQGGERYLVSLSDQSQWLKNVRAAQGRAVIVRRGKIPIRLVEIPVEERAPILLGYVHQRAFTHSGKASARLFFGLDPDPTLEQMEAIAGRFPVFRIEAGTGG